MYLRVIWRFRIVVLAGFILAVVLSASAYWKVGKGGITHRQAETWQSVTTLGLTQGGFPWGRTTFPTRIQNTPAGQQLAPSIYADPNRFYSLSTYYSFLANSDAVRALFQRGQRTPGTVRAQAVTDPANNYPEPFVQFIGSAPTASAATSNANRGAAAFKRYMTQQQIAAGIPQGQRVALATINEARGAVLAAGRRKTTPIVIFLTIMLAAIGVAFILENLRPRVRLVAEQDEETPTARAAGGRHGA
jgi:hypothetical protein